MKSLLLTAICLSAASVYAQTDNMPDNTAQSGSCINVPVTLSGDSKDLTVTPSVVTKTNNVYMYYHERRARRDFATGEFADLPDARASKPILLRDKQITKLLPQNYKITVTSPQSTVTACQDSTLNLTASINAEQESEYTGNYPTTTRKNTYVLVSKHNYKKAERKLAKVERKERKVGRSTGVTPMGV